MYIGSLEAGGTKMLVAIADENGNIIDKEIFPTLEPAETMPMLIDYFKRWELSALGIGTFGPVDLNRSSDTYGYITSTPKTSWKFYDILGELKRELGIPVGFDTDVNAAALGEATYGCLQGVSDCIYVTIGTGIGVGILSNGSLVYGMLHPEAGHIFITPNPIDTYLGKCPYHGCCFEGLASGPAIEERYGKKPYDLTNDKAVWELEAEYIAKALVNYILILVPKKIVLGGGVMHQEQLFPLIRKKTVKLLAGYINTKEIADIDNYIVPSSLDGNQGILGGVALALRELNAGTAL